MKTKSSKNLIQNIILAFFIISIICLISCGKDKEKEAALKAKQIAEAAAAKDAAKKQEEQLLAEKQKLESEKIKSAKLLEQETAQKIKTSENKVFLRVTDSDSSAIAFANIEFYNENQITLPVKQSAAYSFKTDNQGLSIASPLNGGKYILKIAAAGFASELKKIKINKSRTSITSDVFLKKESVIKGIIKNKKGEPVANAKVGPLLPEHIAETEIIIHPEFTTSDANGNFVFTGLQAAKYSLQIQADGYIPAKMETVQAPSDNLAVTLEDGGGTVKGIAAGLRDGKPLPNIGLLLVGEGVMLYKESDAKGEFLFSNLKTGKYSIEPIIDDKRAGKPEGFDSNGQSTVDNIVVKVNQGIILKGVITDADEKIPVPNVVLQIEQGKDIVSAESNIKGEFVFTSVFPDKRIIINIISPDIFYEDEGEALHKEFEIDEYMPDSDIDNIAINIIKIYKINGIVDNIPQDKTQEYKVKIFPQGEESNTTQNLISGISKDRKFKIDVRGSGKYSIAVVDSTLALAGAPVDFFASSLNEPESLVLSITPPAELAGIVRDHAQNPLPGAVVKASGKHGITSASTDQNGEFKINTYENMVSFNVTSDKYKSKIEKEVKVAPDQKLEFVFQEGNTLYGTVVTPDNNPISGAEITIRWMDLASRNINTNRATTDEGGKFAFAGITGNLIDNLICKASVKNETGTAGDITVEKQSIELPSENLNIIIHTNLKIKCLVTDQSGNYYTGKITFKIQVADDTASMIYADVVPERDIKNGEAIIQLKNTGKFVLEAKTNTNLYGLSAPFDISADKNDNSIQIKLSSLQSIQGNVFDKETNAALSNVRVIIGNQSGNIVTREITKTANDGHFEITAPGDGDFVLSFFLNNYSELTAAIKIENGKIAGESPLKIFMEKSNSVISGIVVNKNTEPEANVVVSVRKFDSASEETSGFIETKTDDKGSFTLHLPTAGKLIISAEKGETSADKVITVNNNEEKYITLTLKKLIEVKGKLKTQNQNILRQPLIFKNILTEKTTMTKLDSDGNFVILLSEGDYTVLAGETDLATDVKISGETESVALELAL